jgi:rhamnogalacturonan endolyase
MARVRWVLLAACVALGTAACSSGKSSPQGSGGTGSQPQAGSGGGANAAGNAGGSGAAARAASGGNGGVGGSSGTGATGGAPAGMGGGDASVAKDAASPAASDAGSADALEPPLCPTPMGAPVTVQQNGSAFTLDNGLLTVAINGAGNVTSVRKNKQALMASGHTLYVSSGGGSSYRSLGATSRSIVQQSDDLVELSFVDPAADMNWDLHYLMVRGVSGFYYFLVTDTKGKAATTLSELRTVQRFDPAVLSNGYNGERHGALPSVAQASTFSSSTQIQDATYPLPNGAMLAGAPYSEGPVFSKYDWASYRTEDRLHGLYGNGYGAWLLSPSWEFYTGGPVKQELMVHDSNLILNMYHGGHFGSATTQASPADWQKVYGPNLLYVNAGTDAEVIADAAMQAEHERRQWPYCFIKHDAYPLQRGSVTGQLVESHGRSVAGAMVVLAEPGTLLDQGYGYIFWAKADADGRFAIGNVRPGSYAVHVYATQGDLIDDIDNGEIVQSNVTVKAGDNALGTLNWSPPYHAKLLWSIGTSDRTAGEFRVQDATANATGRMYGTSATAGVWELPPPALTYTIGSSVPATDWYFAQSKTGTWTVAFDLGTVPASGATLTLGIAGAARNPHLDVAVNGHSVLSHGFGNDQTLYRSALQGGRFELLTASVPAADLKAGANTATLALTNGGGGVGIYYDVLKLESD